MSRGGKVRNIDEAKQKAEPGTVTLKKSELMELNMALAAVANVAGSAKWAYAVERTRRHINGEVEAIRKAAEPPTEFQELEKKRAQLRSDHTAKDDTGRPKRDSNGQPVFTDPKKLEAELAVLDKEHEAAIEAQKRREKEVEEILEEEVSIRVHSLPLEQFPDGLSPAHFRLFWPMIEEPTG